MAQSTASRLRARHDAGREPLPWRRLLLLLGSLGVTTGLTVAGAGLLRVGPLARIGWAEQVLAPQQVLAAGSPSTATVLEVGVPWTAPAFCPDDLDVTVTQAADRVVIGQVRSRVPRVGLMVRACTQQRTRQGRAYAQVRLTAPLRGRAVVTTTGQRLTVLVG